MTFSVIGYVVFDPTTMIFLVPLFIAIIPLTAAQVWLSRKWLRVDRAIEYYVGGVARLEDRWQGLGNAGEKYFNLEHPYAVDLDVFGRGSMFELLCTARSQMGCDTLANWLQAAADRRQVVRRQQAVAELKRHPEWREELAVVDADGDAIRREVLDEWAAVQPVFSDQAERSAGRVLIAGVLIGGAGVLIIGRVWWTAFALALILEILFFLRARARMTAFAQSVNHSRRALAAFSRFAATVRGWKSENGLIRELQQELLGRRGELKRLASAYRSLPGDPLLLCLAAQVWPDIEDRHRAMHGTVAKAFQAWGEVEALTSLATYAYENPTLPFPEIVDGQPCFEGVDVTHPLIARARAVPNDVTLNAEHSLVLISGSNMSGKSTLLRSTGLNTALALAGAPVRAERLRVSVLNIAAAMRFRDSVQDGTSYFFSVVRRLRSSADLLNGPRPVLFLFDELLQGTNSHDRRIGAEAVLKKFVEKGALGLVTTHDLSLTEIIADFNGRASNAHFEDSVVDGEMTFDFRMRPGIVQKSNALALMRAAGLDV